MHVPCHRRAESEVNSRYLDEVASLLALGFLRLKARQSSQKERENGDTSLDNRPEESVDRTTNSEGEKCS